jgi:hypothetical protein
LVKLQPFIETDYVRVNILRPAGQTACMMPYVYPEFEILPVKHEAIPADELAVRRGARVEVTDGRVGHVDEFLLDPANDHITHPILREGHLWGQKNVSIPVSEIERIKEDRVHLKLDRGEIAALPAIPVRRR